MEVPAELPGTSLPFYPALWQPEGQPQIQSRLGPSCPVTSLQGRTGNNSKALAES